MNLTGDTSRFLSLWSSTSYVGGMRIAYNPNDFVLLFANATDYITQADGNRLVLLVWNKT